MSIQPKKVLVVEDEPLIRLGLVGLLEESGYDTVEVGSADAAAELLARDSDAELVVSDVDMPGRLNGIDLAHLVAQKWPHIKLILVSGKVGLSKAQLPVGARFFPKPFNEPELISTIDTLVAGPEGNPLDNQPVAPSV